MQGPQEAQRLQGKEAQHCRVNAILAWEVCVSDLEQGDKGGVGELKEAPLDS